jgi:2,4-dienoyl-CoA reductase-like NADH-dependent reductase (Old Yellow Enzyme family)/thioredoxin reductase
MTEFPRLFSPWRLAGMPLRNRVIGAAISSIFPAAGAVTDRLVELYANRARGGVALMVTEALKGHRAQSAPTRIRADSDDFLEGLKRWAGAVEEHDCRLVGQIYDPGRGRHHPGRGQNAIGASALPDDLSWTVPRAMTRAEISGLVAEFSETAHRLQRAGFSGVELSCGHGHLFHQFLSPQANRRDDEYGGDTEGRTRLVRELCAAIRKACGDAFILGIKLVGDDGVRGGVDQPEAERIVSRIVGGGGVSYLAMVRGAHHRTLEAHMPDRTYAPVPYREMTRRMRPFADGTPMIGIGRITTPDEAESMLEAGDCDGVMLGRALLADAAWVEKARDGDSADTRLCISCNTCWETITDLRPIICDVNPRLGTPDEATWRPPRAESRRRVVVVGAGLSGLEAAWVAAGRGHDVTVLGASDSVGGAMRLNTSIPGCGQLGRTYEYQLRQATAAGVKFRLGARASAADIVALEPDEIVLATGSRMIRPPGLEDESGAVDLRTAVRSLLAESGRRAGKGVVFDMDHTAGTYDAYEFFADRFDSVLLLTPREMIAHDVSLVTRQRVQRRVYGRRLPVIVFAELVGFSDGVLSIRDVHTGDVTQIDGVAMLAYSTPRVPDDSLADELRERGLAVTQVGDCRVPRSTAAAIREGFEAGLAA